MSDTTAREAYALTHTDDDLAEYGVHVIAAEGRDQQRLAATDYLAAAWLHGEAATVWRARAAYAFARTYPSTRGDAPYNGNQAAKAAAAIGLLGLGVSQFTKLAKAGLALTEAGHTALGTPTDAEAAVVGAVMHVQRVGSGARNKNKGSAGRDPGQTASTPGVPTVPDVAPGEVAAPVVDVPEGAETATLAVESWADDVLSTLRRFARNATIVTTTETEREAIAEACAHLVARLEEEAERRAVLAAEDLRARGQEVPAADAA